MNENSYSPPVMALIGYGPALGADWPDYRSKLGLTPTHIPELIRVIADPDIAQKAENEPEAWGSAHAWRALAQMGAVGVIAPMARLAGSDEGVLAFLEFEQVVKLIGPRAAPILKEILTGRSRAGTGRIAAINGMAALARDHKEVRPLFVEAICEALRQPRRNSIEVNASLVRALCDQCVKEALPIIEAAFLAQQVDLSEVTWEDVQSALGS
jgi:Protein of unknown function (DUF1186)